MTAYFTDPMSDEFKKAIEEALKEIEGDQKTLGKRHRKSSTKKLSAKIRKEMQ